MNSIVEVTTQAELESTLKAKDIAKLITGNFFLEVFGSDSPQVIICGGVSFKLLAWESSQPHVVAWESSQPHVVARGSSQPHVVAWESSQPHVVAWESSQPHVVARESSQPHVVAWESSQPHVEARGSSQPYVVAWGSSQPHVVAWESSQPHVVAWESSQPHVVARGSSQPHVVAWGYVQLSIFGKVIVKAEANVSVLVKGVGASVKGGRKTVMPLLDTPKKWCDCYGVPVKKGVAILFKAVDNAFKSSYNGFSYKPGTIPKAPDWDGGKRECGGGLHFSPHPLAAKSFNTNAVKYCACPVRLKDIVVHPNGRFPEKVKASGCCSPVWEVDMYGNKK